MIDETLTGKPASDIIYIGRAKKPIKKIIGGYVGGVGGKSTKQIHKTLFNEGYIEKTSISWMQSKDLKKSQKELLEKFKKEHGGYPAWNPSSKQRSTISKAKPKKAKAPKQKKPITQNVKTASQNAKPSATNEKDANTNSNKTA
jgi:hypothetical protein